MPNRPLVNPHTISSAQIEEKFWTSHNLRGLERLQLDKHGVPMPHLLASAPVRVGFVIFTHDGFDFHPPSLNGGGTRAFLFLIQNQNGEALDIVAWAPLVHCLSTWLNRAWVRREAA